MAKFSGDLNGDGIPATDPVAEGSNGNVRSVLDSEALGDGAVGNAISGSTLMVNLVDANGNVVADGNNVILSPGIKGGASSIQKKLFIDATTTVDDFMTWLREVSGINTSSSLPDWYSGR